MFLVVLRATVLASVVGCSHVVAAQQDIRQNPPSPISIDGGLRASTSLVYWRGSYQSAGFQSFTPLELWTSTSVFADTKIDVAVKSAYVHSQSKTTDLTGSVSSISDTVGHVQIAFDRWSYLQPFVTLNVNAPTGTATLYGSQKNAIMDRDLVFQTRFGEGWNFNPAVGVTIPIGSNLVASLGVGYNIRHSYVPDGDLAFLYDPGDQLIATAGLQYLSQAWLMSVNGIFSRETTSQLEGMDYFKPGDGYTVSAQVSHMWNDRHTTSINGQYNHTRRNVSTNLLMGTFGADEKNTNSDLYVASLAHHYALTPSWKLYISSADGQSVRRNERFLRTRQN